jgi:hypothetical protein
MARGASPEAAQHAARLGRETAFERRAVTALRSGRLGRLCARVSGFECCRLCSTQRERASLQKLGHAKGGYETRAVGTADTLARHTRPPLGVARHSRLMHRQAVPPSLVVAVALVAGLATGVLIGRHWSAAAWRHAWAHYEQARREWTRSLQDREAGQRGAGSAIRSARAVEVRRAQVSSHCAVSFEVRDTVAAGLELFRAQAREPSSVDTGVIAEGWSYREGGYRKGDTATVVLPHIPCGNLWISGFGWSSAAPVWPASPQLDIR